MLPQVTDSFWKCLIFKIAVIFPESIENNYTMKYLGPLSYRFQAEKILSLNALFTILVSIFAEIVEANYK